VRQDPLDALLDGLFDGDAAKQPVVAVAAPEGGVAEGPACPGVDAAVVVGVGVIGISGRGRAAGQAGVGALGLEARHRQVVSSPVGSGLLFRRSSLGVLGFVGVFFYGWGSCDYF
jgi:hypothetical protein